MPQFSFESVLGCHFRIQLLIQAPRRTREVVKVEMCQLASDLQKHRNRSVNNLGSKCEAIPPVSVFRMESSERLGMKSED
jgi:hypothetical protein